MRRVAGVLLSAAGLLGVGCGPSAVLEEVTERVGLDFVHECGPERTYYMPELMGPGVALFDHDGDGDLDAYLVNGGWPLSTPPDVEPPQNRLYRQEDDGSFTDATDESGLGDTGYGMGLAVGDYDNDGDPDLFVSNFGPNALYRNRGDGTFEDVTELAGTGDDGWGTSALFLDYDADGWLDLFVANYLLLDPDVECPGATGQPEFCPPGRFASDVDRLYHNRGDGTFDDVTDIVLIDPKGRPGLGVVATDLTGDGRVDIYVANDQQPNQLWVNQDDGTFRDEGLLKGVAFNEAGVRESSMGVVAEDLDGDGRLDLFMTHLRGETNTVFRNQGDGLFDDATGVMGMLESSVRLTGFGVVAVDVEHDGWLDLFLVNGHVFRASVEPGANVGQFWNEYAQPGVFLRNLGRGRFIDASDTAGSFGSDPQVGRGLAAGDVDRDGDLDLLVGNCNGRGQLFFNVADKQGHWLSVAARDEALKRDAYGAQVTVVAGGRRQLRSIATGGSYLSSSEPVAHFGLGHADRVDAIEVVWPGGERERFEGGPADRRITVRRGEGD